MFGCCGGATSTPNVKYRGGAIIMITVVDVITAPV